LSEREGVKLDEAWAGCADAACSAAGGHVSSCLVAALASERARADKLEREASTGARNAALTMLEVARSERDAERARADQAAANAATNARLLDDAIPRAIAAEARADALWKILNDGHGPARAHSEDCRCLWCRGNR
jgi:hypothetical protein